MRARLTRHERREPPFLTARQVELLAAAAAGETLAETAARLWLAHETVKKHHRDIRTRIGARNVTHAVHLAWQQGLLG